MNMSPVREALWQYILAATTTPGRPVDLNDDLFHVMGTLNLAALLAERRGVDRDLAVAGMLLHDIGRLQTGTITGHSELSAALGGPILAKAGFTPEQIEAITLAIETHTDKPGKGNPLEEVLRDADVLDGYLRGEHQSGAALNRVQALKAELGMGGETR